MFKIKILNETSFVLHFKNASLDLSKNNQSFTKKDVLDFLAKAEFLNGYKKFRIEKRNVNINNELYDYFYNIINEFVKSYNNYYLKILNKEKSKWIN